MIIRHYVNPITVILKTQLHKLNLKVLQRDYGHNQIISIKQIVVNNHTNCRYRRHHIDEQTEDSKILSYTNKWRPIGATTIQPQVQ